MSRPNILLLFSDEHSFRFFGHVSEADGGEPAHTPALDELAERATVFTDAYCQMPLCTPSRICMLTGREVRGAGAWENGSVLRPELPTLPGALRDAGYATALVGKMHLGGTQQFVGFQHRPYGDLTGMCGHQGEPIPTPAGGIRERTRGATGVTQIPETLIQDEVVAGETGAFIREHSAANPDQPWFVCAGFSRPHFPLTAPQRHLDRYWRDGVTEPRVPAAGDAYDHPMSVGMRDGFLAGEVDRDEMMHARACYFACVSYLDEIIGDLLARLDLEELLDDTIIVYTTDHGELAGEHGVWWKNGWYEGCTRVPLIVSTPAQRGGDGAPIRCETPVGLTDLMPTLLALAGADAPDSLDGADLSATVTSGSAAPDRPIVCDALTPRWGEGTEFRMVRRGQYKYVRFRAAAPLAFDLAADPGEQHNLLKAGDVPAAVTELAAFAESSIDFDAAETEYLERDGGLREQYAQNVSPRANSQYLLPDGRLVQADEALYNPTVVTETPAEAFGPDHAEQNRTR